MSDGSAMNVTVYPTDGGGIDLQIDTPNGLIIIVIDSQGHIQDACRATPTGITRLGKIDP